MLEQNDQAPHRVLISVQAEVYEVLPSGECNGASVYKDRKNLMLSGKDKDDAINKLQKLLLGLQEYGRDHTKL